MIVTYLLGAGASADCIPVVDGMGKAILEMRDVFEYEFKHNGVKTDENIKSKDEILGQLGYLNHACNTHSSIDTYAKKIFLDNHEREYTRLKNALSVYFTLAQWFAPDYKNTLHIDKRYDNF